MNTVWKALFVLGAVVAVAHGLNCRQCPIGVFGTCFFGSDITCSNGTESCFRGEAQFNATGSLSLHIRGCVDSDLCEKTITSSILGAGFTSSFKCCTTNLCNGVTSVPVSASVALCGVVLSALSGAWDA